MGMRGKRRALTEQAGGEVHSYGRKGKERGLFVERGQTLENVTCVVRLPCRQFLASDHLELVLSANTTAVTRHCERPPSLRTGVTAWFRTLLQFVQRFA